MKQMNIKQLRLRIIGGVNSEGDFTYSEGYDLMNVYEFIALKNISRKSVIHGFSIEVSSFEKGTYSDDEMQNEFIPLIEYLNADDNGDKFIYYGETFTKMAYHFTSDSVLDVNEDMELLLHIIVPGDIETTIEAITDMFGNRNVGKKPKVAYII